MRRPRFTVPSGGPSLPGSRRTRLLALLAARNEMVNLPGFLANVGPQVDGIIALDDGSTDGSAELLESCPDVLEVLRVPPDRPRWDETGNHRALVAAAVAHGAEWVVYVDADERLERRFRMRAERVVRRGRRVGFEAYAVRLRELWDSGDRYRVDGIWGRKAVARLFRVRPDHELDPRPLHGEKAPLQGRVAGRFPLANLEIYHLRMIRPEDRLARRRRYEELDPDSKWQPGIGYAYLTDETGLALRRISPRRRYVE
jgi:glycosyltransferase involved in cell wall biosynthesis